MTRDRPEKITDPGHVAAIAQRMYQGERHGDLRGKEAHPQLFLQGPRTVLFLRVTPSVKKPVRPQRTDSNGLFVQCRGMRSPDLRPDD
ncbi:MAG TPA: hypothetical protein VEZ24_15240 [Microvirga sp.]|nr:hypothetical protein [Microvirga sp.]